MNSDLSRLNTKLAVVGLGYVGLPLAVEFARKFSVVAFDISAARISELQSCKDSTLEVSSEELRNVQNIQFQFSELQDQIFLSSCICRVLTSQIMTCT